MRNVGIIIILLLVLSPLRAWEGQVAIKSSDNQLSLHTQPRDQLLQRLQRLQEQGVMFGHQDDPFYGLGWKWERGRSDVRETCGEYPAVLGIDLGGIEVGDERNLDNVPFDRMREEILAHIARGGIVAASWHPRNPLTGGNAWDVKDSTVVRSILPGGSQHLKFLTWMKRLSAFLQSLKDEHGRPVAIIFRPWHENNGSWFWWGQRLCSDDEYHALWCMLQDHLLSDGLTNIVWSYSPNVMGFDVATFLRRYPGDDRVDIIGLDAYQQPNGETDFIRTTNADLDVLCKYALKAQRLVALTECGYECIPDSTWWTRVLQPILQHHTLSYFLVWRNFNSKHHFAPAPSTKDAPDFRKMVHDNRILMLKDVEKVNNENVSR